MEALKRWRYYQWLILLDLWRLKRSFFLHVMIVAGICLPILILSALKRGHVEQLRDDLKKSPTATEVVAYAAMRGDFLTHRAVQDMVRNLGDVTLAIPEMRRPVLIKKGSTSTAAKGVEVTLYSTLPGDPILKKRGGDVLKDAEDALVLTKQAAESLQVAPGDSITIVLRREQFGEHESSEIKFTVKAVVESDASGNTAYALVDVLNQVERYIQGHGVERWSLPAIKGFRAPDKYARYLLFCNRRDDLRPEDFKMFESRGYVVEKVTDPEFQIWYGLLKPETTQQLLVYSVRTSRSAEDYKSRLVMRPSALSDLTLAEDDVAIPWNEPRRVKLDGRDHLLVGSWMPNRIWLRKDVAHPEAAFNSDVNEFSVWSNAVSSGTTTVKLETSLLDGASLELAVIPTTATPATTPNAAPSSAPVPSAAPTPTAPPTNPVATATSTAPPTKPITPASVKAPSPTGTAKHVEDVSDECSADPEAQQTLPVAFVPVVLLAHLDAKEHQASLFHAGTKTFVPVPEEPIYDKVRMYPVDIDHVPGVVERLQRIGYAVTSEYTRIKEIHSQDASLGLLVTIVMWGVLVFGVLTVTIVLADSTDRKRKAIGIMRIMGVSSLAVSYMVVVRSAVIGIVAAIVAGLFGWGFCELLSWRPPADATAWVPESLRPSADWLLQSKPVAEAVFDVKQDQAFFLATMICSMIGALVPAYKVSKLDPFDAIVESRSS